VIRRTTGFWPKIVHFMSMIFMRCSSRKTRE
jgi:hypothetical protein